MLVGCSLNDNHIENFIFFSENLSLFASCAMLIMLKKAKIVVHVC